MSKAKSSGEIGIHLRAGDSEPQWKIDTSCPFYEEILEGLKKTESTPLPEEKDNSYKGFVIHQFSKQDCCQSDGNCLHSIKAGANRGLEILLLNSAPDFCVSNEIKQLVKTFK